MGSKPNWKPEDIEYLSSHWGNTPINLLAKNLKRSENAIMIKKQKLKLGAFLESGDYITFNQLRLALGRVGGGGYMLKSWIENRALPVKNKKVNKCTFMIIYLKSFWEWAEKNRMFINFSKVTENVLGEEPEWVKEQRRFYTLKSMNFITTPWTKTEDDHLIYLLKQYKYGYTELSEKLHRTCGAIQRRVCDLGLKERPVRADNHTPWTDAQLIRLTEMIKRGFNYEHMSLELGKSTKAIRGKIYVLYGTETLDKARERIAALKMEA